MNPINARIPENHDYIFKRVNGEKIEIEGAEKCKFQFGDRVRKLINKNIFDKGFTQKFSDETYLISRAIYAGVPIYFLERDPKWYYERELRLVDAT
jgi:hypothetical protein